MGLSFGSELRLVQALNHVEGGLEGILFAWVLLVGEVLYNVLAVS